MSKRQRKTNPQLHELLEQLYTASGESGIRLWRDVAKRLERPRRLWRSVNVGHVARHAKANDTVLVPGKLLAAGEIDKPVTVAAFSFSDAAAKKIGESGGRAILLPDLLRENPSGSGVRILG
jgi:large subunit ribosomal protein L18e